MIVVLLIFFSVLLAIVVIVLAVLLAKKDPKEYKDPKEDVIDKDEEKEKEKYKEEEKYKEKDEKKDDITENIDVIDIIETDVIDIIETDGIERVRIYEMLYKTIKYNKHGGDVDVNDLIELYQMNHIEMTNREVVMLLFGSQQVQIRKLSTLKKYMTQLTPVPIIMRWDAMCNFNENEDFIVSHNEIHMKQIPVLMYAGMVSYIHRDSIILYFERADK